MPIPSCMNTHDKALWWPQREWLRAQVLVTERPEATTALLMDLCTGGKESGEPGGEWVAKVADFAHLYTERCASPASQCTCRLDHNRTAKHRSMFHQISDIKI